MSARYRDFARYNAWANRRLYDAAAPIPDPRRRVNLGAFFGSLHATMNHLLVGDVIWMNRFLGSEEPPPALDAVLHDDFESLRAAREDLDTRIVAFVDGLSPQDLAAPLAYRTVTKPVTVTQPLETALDHFFNHQTHHRGQAHCLLTMLTGAAPSFDLLVFQRETGAGNVRSTPVG